MRVLTLGDSPFGNTGFGRVNAVAVKAFQEQGWSVGSVTGLTMEPPADSHGVEIFLPEKEHDVLGLGIIEQTVKMFRPDIVYMTADVGTVVALASVTPDMPSFSYIPIEGAPIVNKDWSMMLSSVPMLTCSRFGSDLIKTQLNRDVDYVYHGVDHDVYNVKGVRDDVRKAMKWDGRFVITCVANNVRRKQIPRLIEAVSILKHQYKQKDIALYLHTVPFQKYWLEGHNLMEVVKMYDVEKEVFFHPAMSRRGASIPERGVPENPGLADLYEASDLFVLPSQVEGFGLPIAEAMACGVPVLVTKYAAGWEVASPAGRGIPVADWEVHKSSTLYANVSVPKMAEEILRLKRNPKDRQRMSAMGLERVKDFQWSGFTEKLIPAMEQAIVTYQERHTIAKAKDSTEEPAGQQEHDIRLIEGEDTI